MSRSSAARALAALLLAVVAGCGADPVRVPVRAAGPSRHGVLEADLAREAHAYAFDDGDWLEDAGEAPFFGLGVLARRVEGVVADADELRRRDAALVRAEALLASGGEVGAETVMAAFGVVEYVAASGDRGPVPVLDAFLDALDAQLEAAGDWVPATAPGVSLYGATAVTATIALLEAQAALHLGETRRIARVRAIDRAIVGHALGDLADVATGASVRAFAFGPGQAGIDDLPNASMLLLKSRLFRLTGDEAYRLEARSVYAALEDLKLTDVPARYSATYAKPLLGTTSRDVVTLGSAGTIALALLFMFEITGESRFVDEADRAVDAMAQMRASYCVGARCASGLVDTLVDGKLGATFDAGANLEALYVIGYRRMLAGERY